MAAWTVTDGAGHVVRVLVKGGQRGSRIGFWAVMQDAETGEEIGSSHLVRTTRGAVSVGNRLARTWWPAARLALPSKGVRVAERETREAVQ